MDLCDLPYSDMIMADDHHNNIFSMDNYDLVASTSPTCTNSSNEYIEYDSYALDCQNSDSSIESYVELSRNQSSSFKQEEKSTEMFIDTTSNDQQMFYTESPINPDDFLIDYYKSETSTILEDDGQHSPSPSSHSSSDYSSNVCSSEYRIDMSPNSPKTNRPEILTKLNGNQMDNKIKNSNISTQTPLSSSSTVFALTTTAAAATTRTTTSSIMPKTQSSATSMVISTQPVNQFGKINILQGTLIPIQTVPINMRTASAPHQPQQISNIKKLKIKPKPVQINNIPIQTTNINQTIQNTTIETINQTTMAAGGTGKKKTIVLSAQDYTALMEKCKSQRNMNSIEPIMVKTSLANELTELPVKFADSIVEIGSTTNFTTSHHHHHQTQFQVINKKASPVQHQHQQQSQPPSTIKPLIAVKTALKLDIEEKILKKHQRMIKNRESACLSRKKKKDYMSSLENRVTVLQQENEKLKTENSFLRERLTTLEMVACKCGNMINRQVSNVLSSTTTNRKNAIFLMAMVFMVFLNFGPIGNLFITQMRAQSIQPASMSVHHSRGILWVDENQQINSSTILSTDELSIIPKTGVPKEINNNINNNQNTTTTKIYPTCPLYVNQTESVRLASELRRWIGELPNNGYNLSSSGTNDSNSVSNSFDLNVISNYFFNGDILKTLFHQIKNIKNYVKKKSSHPRKMLIENNGVAAAGGGGGGGGGGAATRSNDVGVGGIDSENEIQQTNLHKSSSPSSPPQQYGNKVQIYNPIIPNSIKYAELFEELRRQDDTFYVVSFSGDHLLLPALAHNKTFRPKMSLMLPSVGRNGTYSSEYITLMQIDCEVVNTSIIQVKEKLIPKHLRNKSQSTSSSPSSPTSSSSSPSSPSSSSSASTNSSSTTTSTTTNTNHQNETIGSPVTNNVRRTNRKIFVDPITSRLGAMSTGRIATPSTTTTTTPPTSNDSSNKPYLMNHLN